MPKMEASRSLQSTLGPPTPTPDIFGKCTEELFSSVLAAATTQPTKKLFGGERREDVKEKTDRDR